MDGIKPIFKFSLNPTIDGKGNQAVSLNAKIENSGKRIDPQYSCELNKDILLLADNQNLPEGSFTRHGKAVKNPVTRFIENPYENPLREYKAQKHNSINPELKVFEGEEENIARNTLARLKTFLTKVPEEFGITKEQVAKEVETALKKLNTIV